VYKVMSPGKHIYALKRIRISHDDVEGMRSLANEIDLLTQLRGCERIIQLVDSEVNHEAGIINMVLQCGEIDLATLMKRQAGKGMNENNIRHYWQQMLEAVHTIHEARIVHADLKPANFLLVEGAIKLIDFGIAKAVPNDTTNIVREQQVGTLNYMSPESISISCDNQKHKLGRSSDIWSLGCILYQMVYGQTPFSTITNVLKKMNAITDENYAIPFPPLRDQSLANAIHQCLQRNPRNRPSIPELLEHPFLRPSSQASLPTTSASTLNREQVEAVLKQLQVAKLGGGVSTDNASLAEQILLQLQQQASANTSTKPLAETPKTTAAPPRTKPPTSLRSTSAPKTTAAPARPKPPMKLK